MPPNAALATTGDRRIYARVAVSLPADYHLPGADGPAGAAVILDVSESGICLLSDVDLKPGTELVLKIQLHEKAVHAVWVSAVVVRRASGGNARQYAVGCICD